MLASITPLGERGRGSHWGITVAAFALAATGAGAAAGALLGLLGDVVLGSGVSEQARLLVLSAGLLLAVVADLTGHVPGPHRQVDERWLDEFRGWVYGAGFGAQLGLGVTTVVPSAATYAAGLAAFLTGRVGAGAVILGCFGAVRGLTPLVAAHVRRPDQLIALHAAIDRRRGTVRAGAPVLLALVLALTLGVAA
jgi:hypothetical protein